MLCKFFRGVVLLVIVKCNIVRGLTLPHAVHHDVSIDERMSKKRPKVVRIDQGETDYLPYQLTHHM